MDILILPDAHAHPDYDNERFSAVGRYIRKHRPENIVCIGDFADLPSLCSHDRGGRSFEGRRYRSDLEAAYDAMDRLCKGIRGSYSPNMVMCLGNHENRIERLVEEHPSLYESLSIEEDLAYENWGWAVVPFKAVVEIGGIHFSHYFPSGVQGRAISGVNISHQMCNKLHVSAVQGHSHLYSHAEQTRPDGKKIFGLSVGCLSHPAQIEGWNRDTARMWWRGIVHLRDCDGEGYYDEIAAITLRKLMRDYH